MAIASSSHSPDIQIHLEIGKQRIRLSDVLYDSAALFETAQVAPHTRATLVFLIDGVEEREEVVLEQGISTQDSLIKFSYADRMNGRHFSW